MHLETTTIYVKVARPADGKAIPSPLDVMSGQAEAFLNGHRIYYGPVREDVPAVYADLTAVGASVRLIAVEWDELIEQP